MRPLILVLAGLLALGACPARAATVAADPEAILAALRSSDPAECAAALAAIPALPGYPKSAEDLVPALLWMGDGDDATLAAQAHAQAAALGWPRHYCLACVHRLAQREDPIYKMMALSVLVKLAWLHPAAMALLLEINRTHARGMGNMVRAFSATLMKQHCGDHRDINDWNHHAARFRDRMITALHGGGKKMRPIAQALLLCGQLDPAVLAEAQAVVASTTGSQP